MTPTQYARHRKAKNLPGQTIQAVRAALKTGRISHVAGAIDPDLADREWAENTSAINGGDRRTPKTEVTEAEKKAAERVVREAAREHGAAIGDDDPVSIGMSHSVLELMKAAEKTIAVRKMRGLVIDLAEGERRVERWGHEVKEMHSAVPASECEALAEAMTQDCSPKTARRELDRIMRGLQDRMSQRAFRMAEPIDA